MTQPVTFARLPEGDNPASLLDDMFQWLSGFVFIPCQAIGQNDIELFPFADAPGVLTYTDLAPVFTFMATQTNTGNVRLNVMNAQGAGLGPAVAYKANGGAVIAAGDLVAGLSYQAYWQTSLNGGAGGFVVNVGGTGGPLPPPIPFPPPPIPGGNSMPINMIFFTTAGTYTPSPGMVSAIVECVGGGGGGGGAFGNGSHAGGGGGSGGFSRGLLSATDIGTSQAILIGTGGAAGSGGNGGAGGVTSFGNLVVANRGLVLPGNGGGAGFAITTPIGAGYNGASGTMWGGAAQQFLQGGSAADPGIAGKVGAGGTGGVASLLTTNNWVPGGAGGPGWCCITEFS